MSGKILAQLIIGLTSAGSRVFVAAYQQALSNAKRGGGTAAAGGAAINAMRGKMQSGEAKEILNLQDLKEIDEIIVEEKFKKMYELNSPDSGGSFYLQSKIFRAKEALFRDMKLEVENPLDQPEEGEERATQAEGEDAPSAEDGSNKKDDPKNP
jgi:mitochondrial import inner membrane translocase subunit TIM16